MEDMLHYIPDDGPLASRTNSQKDVMKRLNSIQGVDVIMTSIACPVQLEGSIGGRAFYFRSRGDSWSFTIAALGDDPVWPEKPAFVRSGYVGEPNPTIEEMIKDMENGTYDAEKLNYAAGWLDAEEMEEIFMKCLEEYRNE